MPLRGIGERERETDSLRRSDKHEISRKINLPNLKKKTPEKKMMILDLDDIRERERKDKEAALRKEQEKRDAIIKAREEEKKQKQEEKEAKKKKKEEE
eukprot:CAMPEP_0201539372 /NCGR_PEP_ID=MMETSP0161_2-20130828/70203_1 /ASSEMBLY_ACC=CAM_ASM_000251 /TAXON_ID=180227 /ORGANISM="Neoparamoeba aestuarina, Strain SoJaBio B1-5/56/2" /LENGTH=97 /DNA_ID=CAMNT_0047946719 /DNA_START=1 /DNA_END=291 /DNA_ORIENTATION=+